MFLKYVDYIGSSVSIDFTDSLFLEVNAAGVLGESENKAEKPLQIIMSFLTGAKQAN